MTYPRPCQSSEPSSSLDRRQFLKTAGAAAVIAGVLPAGLSPEGAKAEDAKPAVSKEPPENFVKKLYASLNETQRKEVAFDWDYKHPKRGLLRTHVSNNWSITTPTINSEFFTKDQKDLIRAIFEGLYQPDWVPQIDAQLKCDAGGYGNHQSIALFGKPGEDKFEFVMTGRHLTGRCDGNSSEHRAFGGPIFYGHAASGFNEKPGHPDNIFWPQALMANKVYEMLDGAQRKKALVPRTPDETAVAFRGDAQYPGIAIADLSRDQREQVEKTLAKLLEPYRQTDQQEVMECLKKQGGLEKCGLAFYQAGDLGDDEIWDNWRLEGPSFVWYFRGTPHVHVWVNIADDATVSTNTASL